MRGVFIALLFTFLLSACSKEDVVLPELLSFTPAKGGAGNLVYLRGKSFGEDSSRVVIDFNGKAAKIRLFDDSLVVLEVPEGATTGKIGYSIDGKRTATVEAFTVLPGKWVRRKDLPENYEPRGLGIGLGEGSVGYIGLGYNGGTTLKDLWSYDPSLDNWTRLPDGGLDMQGAVHMIINNKIYVGLGQAYSQNPSFHNQFWEYDPSSQTWTRKQDFPGPSRAGATGIAYGNKGYVGLGESSGGSVLRDWWEYDPATDNWTRKTDNPSQAPLKWPASMLVASRIFLGTSSFIESREWYEYQPVSDTWIRRADFPGRIIFAPSAFVMGNRGYIMGGAEECWQYDPAADRWTEYAFIRSIIGGMAFAVNGRGFYVPGAGGGGSSDAPYLGRELWEFVP